MPKLVDTEYARRKTVASLNNLHAGNNINSTVDFIQDNAGTLRDKHVIIHTGANNILRYRNTIEQRLERLEVNLKFRQCTSVSYIEALHREFARTSSTSTTCYK